MVAEVGNPLPAPEQVMARLLRIEFLLGRTRDRKDGPRTIDLDLLLYGELESKTEFLMLPHPRLHERRFVLEPLVEVAPHLVHPTFNCTAAELLERVDDKSAVRRWAP
jgi:2-amino-4-hydroxy-6-hydroxymethyldihydropteridine diphosphokinase